MSRKIRHFKLPDTHQSSWQLAVIQLAGVASLPVLATSILILQNHSFITAVLTLLVGNALLWVIRLGIVAMSHKDRKSTLDISREYVGEFGGYLIALLLLASTLAWFIVQTTIASNSLTFLIPVHEASSINRFVQTSVLLGIISTLCCMEGIVALRWLTTFSFPILVIALSVIIFVVPHPKITFDNISISLSGLFLLLATNLGVTADLPTFFRHSRSWKSSMRALVIIQIVSFFLGVGGLYLGEIINPWFGIYEKENIILTMDWPKIFLLILIFVSAICANVGNVYSASVGWELIAPIFAGRKEYLILGLGSTIIFILVGNIFSLDVMLMVTDNSLVNLCIILVIGYLLSLFNKAAPDFTQQVTYFIAWLLATAFNVLYATHLIRPIQIPLIVEITIILIVISVGTFIKITMQKSKVRM